MKYFYLMESVVALAFYTKEQYALLLQTADDRKKLHNSWEEFLAGFIKAKTSMEVAGMEVIDYIVDVHQMAEHFRKNKQKNTAENRAGYVSEMASKEK